MTELLYGMGEYCPTQVRDQVSFTTHPGRGESVERDEGAENDSKKTAAQRLSATLVYRYQPPASAPIDAGELVADNGKIGDYRY